MAGHQRPGLGAEANRLHRSITRQLKEWRNDQWSTTLESIYHDEQSLWGMTKQVMRIPTPSSPGHLVGIDLSGSEKAEALGNSLETQFQPMTFSSVPAVIEVVDVARRS